MRGYWVAALKNAGLVDQRGADLYDHPDLQCPSQLVAPATRWTGRSGSDNLPRYTYGGPGTWQHDLLYYGHNSFTYYVSMREGLIGSGMNTFAPTASLQHREAYRGVVATCPAMGVVLGAAWYFKEPHLGCPDNPFPNPGAGWDSSADSRWRPRAQNFLFLDGHVQSEVR
jgi:hypothetical protein